MFLRKYENQIYAVLRIAAGFLFLWHGTQKYFGFPQPSHSELYVILITGTIELIGGFLIMIGLYTPWAAFFASGGMAYAYWVMHAPKNILPLLNRGELAVLYCFVFLFIAARGSGIWSVEHMLHRRKSTFIV